MNEQELKDDASKVAQTAGQDAKAGFAWLSAHPAVAWFLVGLMVGVAIGFALFHA